jgi:hypothetical protein
MASTSKQKTTMAKRDRENRLRERRELKQAKKDARKLAAQAPDPTNAAANEQVVDPADRLGPDGTSRHLPGA